MSSPATIPRSKIETIVFATDFSVSSQRALSYATAMTRRCHAQLILAHVLISAPPLAEEAGTEYRIGAHVDAEAEEKLEHLGSSEPLSSLPHEMIIRCGEVWNGLARIVDERQADLVVLGTRGLTGLQRLRLGSTAEDVTRSVPCPAMIVGPNAVATASERFHRILCATNFAPASLHALQQALVLASEDHAMLRLVHVLPPETHPVRREQLIRQYTGKLLEALSRVGAASPNVGVEVLFGKPATEIVRCARELEADLIVMGVHAAGRASTFLPSILHHVLSHAPCPVLTTCGG